MDKSISHDHSAWLRTFLAPDGVWHRFAAAQENLTTLAGDYLTDDAFVEAMRTLPGIEKQHLTSFLIGHWGIRGEFGNGCGYAVLNGLQRMSQSVGPEEALRKLIYHIDKPSQLARTQPAMAARLNRADEMSGEAMWRAGEKLDEWGRENKHLIRRAGGEEALDTFKRTLAEYRLALSDMLGAVDALRVMLPLHEKSYVLIVDDNAEQLHKFARQVRRLGLSTRTLLLPYYDDNLKERYPRIVCSDVFDKIAANERDMDEALHLLAPDAVAVLSDKSMGQFSDNAPHIEGSDIALRVRAITGGRVPVAVHSTEFRNEDAPGSLERKHCTDAGAEATFPKDNLELRNAWLTGKARQAGVVLGQEMLGKGGNNR